MRRPKRRVRPDRARSGPPACSSRRRQLILAVRTRRSRLSPYVVAELFGIAVGLAGRREVVDVVVEVAGASRRGCPSGLDAHAEPRLASAQATVAPRDTDEVLDRR